MTNNASTQSGLTKANQLEITVSINGTPETDVVEVRQSLSDYIRDNRKLTGTHLGCEHGVCGACTILLDGQAVRSCLMLAVHADGAEITTIEGLAGPNGELHPIQQAFHDSHGFQCAFCAPGFVMTTLALLENNATPTSEEIREELSGNLCRCTGYHTILKGVETAVQLHSSGGATSSSTSASSDSSPAAQSSESGATHA